MQVCFCRCHCSSSGSLILGAQTVRIFNKEEEGKQARFTTKYIFTFSPPFFCSSTSQSEIKSKQGLLQGKDLNDVSTAGFLNNRMSAKKESKKGPLYEIERVLS